MSQRMPVYIGKHTIQELLHACRQGDINRFLLVADGNTYRAFGETVEAALRGQGHDVILALLEGEEIIANDHYLMQVFLKTDRQERVFLAVGSGTITDITRFVSHRTKNLFFSIPTAPSVDGFTSIVAPLVIGGIKRSYPCQGPDALFADLPTLCAAPGAMIAAGFGDMIGKLLSTADWKLGHLLWDEPFDEHIYQRLKKVALDCSQYAGEIGRASEQGVRVLIEALIESGFCMLDFGNSSPASGAEHHISHFWELKLLHEHRPAILHGAKVGVASVITAGWYEAVRKMGKSEAAALLEKAEMPAPDETVKQLRINFGAQADQVIAEHSAFIFMDKQDQLDLKTRILDRWELVLEIARGVPSPSQIENWLRLAGGPVTARELDLGEDEMQLGLEAGHYLRNRFSINKLRHFLEIA